MKQVTIADFMTEEMQKEAIAIYTGGVRASWPPGVHRRLVALLHPHMAEIDRKLGQKNSADYLAYMVEYALSLAAERRK